MYGGRDETVSLICENRLIGVILDRFSTNVMIIPEGSSHFIIEVTQATPFTVNYNSNVANTDGQLTLVIVKLER